MILFYIATTMTYLIGAGWLLWEFHDAPRKDRYELQTAPLLIGVTVLYLAVVLKTQQLAVLFQQYR